MEPLPAIMLVREFLRIFSNLQPGFQNEYTLSPLYRFVTGGGKHPSFHLGFFVPFALHSLEDTGQNFLVPAANRIARQIPYLPETSQEPFELPQGVQAAQAVFNCVRARLVIDHRPIDLGAGDKPPYPAQVLPWCNIEQDMLEQRSCLPTWRFDIRLLADAS